MAEKKEYKVQATLRVGRGKNDARRARRDGMVPITVYGGGAETVGITCITGPGPGAVSQIGIRGRFNKSPPRRCRARGPRRSQGVEVLSNCRTKTDDADWG